MRRSYDFSRARPRPYAKRVKKAVTIRLQPEIIAHFKAMSLEIGIPYQNLINLSLLDCAKGGRRLALAWKNRTGASGDHCRRCSPPSDLVDQMARHLPSFSAASKSARQWAMRSAMRFSSPRSEGS